MKIETIFEEYKANALDDTDEMYNLKDIIFNKLTEVQRRLILMYAETQSYSKMGKLLNVSSTTAFLQVKEIKNIIKALINEYKHNN